MRSSARVLFAVLAAAILLLSSCNGSDISETFILDSTVRMEVGNETVFAYDPLTCQMAFNRTTGEFRAHSDRMSDYFVVDFKTVPAHLNEEVDADIVWTTDTSVERKKNITLKVMRLEGDTFWLWSSSAHIALTVRILD